MSALPPIRHFHSLSISPPAPTENEPPLLSYFTDRLATRFLISRLRNDFEIEPRELILKVYHNRIKSLEHPPAKHMYEAIMKAIFNNYAHTIPLVKQALQMQERFPAYIERGKINLQAIIRESLVTGILNPAQFTRTLEITCYVFHADFDAIETRTHIETLLHFISPRPFYYETSPSVERYGDLIYAHYIPAIGFDKTALDIAMTTYSGLRTKYPIAPHDTIRRLFTLYRNPALVSILYKIWWYRRRQSATYSALEWIALDSFWSRIAHKTPALVLTYTRTQFTTLYPFLPFEEEHAALFIQKLFHISQL